MIYGSHGIKGGPALGVLPGLDGPFGLRPEAEAGDGVPASLTLLCPPCPTGPGRDQGRTTAVSGNGLIATGTTGRVLTTRPTASSREKNEGLDVDGLH